MVTCKGFAVRAEGQRGDMARRRDDRFVHLGRVCVDQMNARLRQVVNVAGLDTGTLVAWLGYGRDPPTVGTERDGADNGVFLKDDASDSLARDIHEKELGSGVQI